MHAKAHSRRIVVWFAVAGLILAGVAFAAFVNMQLLLAQNARVTHTQTVLETLAETLSLLKDVHGATRGYLITGDDSYLEPYEAAMPRIDRRLKRLAVLVSYDGAQTERLEELRLVAADCIMHARAMIDTYRAEGRDAAFALVELGYGKREMDTARDIVAAMVAEERELLAKRRGRVENAALATLVAGSAGLLLCLAILALVFWLIRRESRQRESTEASLEATVATLELRNAEGRLIGKIGDFLQSCRSSEEAFRLIQSGLPKLLPGTDGAMNTFNNSRNALQMEIRWGDGPQPLPEVLNPDDCWALRRGRLHLVSPEGGEPACPHLPDGTLHALCLPLIAHGETVGVLSMARRSDTPFNQNNQQVMRTVSEQISLALANLRLQEKLRLQSIRDPLTQLYNRRYMEESLQREILRARRHEQPLSVVMLDVDHFKKLNDTHGHEVGDLVLKEFAQLLQQHVRGEDIACRYGGEEFILIMPGAPLKIAVARAETIRLKIRQMMAQHGIAGLETITVSQGVSCFPEHTQEVGELVSLADAALYQAKRSGRDKVMVVEPKKII